MSVYVSSHQVSKLHYETQRKGSTVWTTVTVHDEDGESMQLTLFHADGVHNIESTHIDKRSNDDGT